MKYDVEDEFPDEDDENETTNRDDNSARVTGHNILTHEGVHFFISHRYQSTWDH